MQNVADDKIDKVVKLPEAFKIFFEMQKHVRVWQKHCNDNLEIIWFYRTLWRNTNFVCIFLLEKYFNSYRNSPFITLCYIKNNEKIKLILDCKLKNFGQNIKLTRRHCVFIGNPFPIEPTKQFSKIDVKFSLHPKRKLFDIIFRINVNL